MLVHQAPIRLLGWRASSVEHVDKAHVVLAPSPPQRTDGTTGPAGVRAFIDVIVRLAAREQNGARPHVLLLRPRYTNPYERGFARSEQGQLAPIAVLHAKTSEPLPQGALSYSRQPIIACELREGVITPHDLRLNLPKDGGHFSFPYDLAGPPLRTAQDPSFYLELSWIDQGGCEGTSCWRDGDELTILVSKLSSLG